jgi:hypothetical protein
LRDDTNASVISPDSEPIWITGFTLWFLVDFNPFIAILREIATSRPLVVIQFVDTNFSEITLSPIVPILDATFAWCPLTMRYALSVIFSVPLGVTQLEKILVMDLSSSCSILNTLLSIPLSKHLALE